MIFPWLGILDFVCHYILLVYYSSSISHLFDPKPTHTTWVIWNATMCFNCRLSALNWGCLHPYHMKNVRITSLCASLLLKNYRDIHLKRYFIMNEAGKWYGFDSRCDINVWNLPSAVNWLWSWCRSLEDLKSNSLWKLTSQFSLTQ